MEKKPHVGAVLQPFKRRSTHTQHLGAGVGEGVGVRRDDRQELRRAGRAARPQGGPVSRDAAETRDIGAAPTGFSVFCYRPTSGVGYTVRPNWVLISLVSAAHATDRI